MINIWNIFRSKPVEEIETKPEASNDNDVVSVLNPNRYEKFSELGQALCKAVENNTFYKVVDINTKSYASRLSGVRFSHASTHPGQIRYCDITDIHFKAAEYILDISREGNVNYQVLIKGTYYPIQFHEMDPDVKFFHNENLAPLLEKKVEEESRPSIGMRI